MVRAEDCLKKYGDPRKESNMILYDVPSRLEIGVIPKKMYCNKDLVRPIEKAFENLITSGCVHELKTYDGCFNIRKTTSGGSMSLHSWGICCDFNAAWNGYNKPVTLSQGFVDCFKRAGFDWGGDWKIKDGMHFQLASLDGYMVKPTDNNILDIALEKNKNLGLTFEEIEALYIHFKK